MKKHKILIPLITGLLLVLFSLAVVNGAETPQSTSVEPRLGVGKSAADWQPPIGIPRPEFGITETHDMYQGQTYDYDSGAGPYKDAGNGPYTHYVDNTDSNCTDSGNSYGDATTPRCSFPDEATIALGAVIEMHGGPYTGRFWYTSSGTETHPVFIRGASAQDRPVVSTQMLIRAHYVIVEYIDFDLNQGTEGAISIRPWTADEQVHHVSVRHCEVRNLFSGDAGNTAMMAATSYVDGNITTDIVFYDNHIHPDDLPATPVSYEKDTMGIGVAQNSERVWIVDNHIHHTAGDAVGAGHAANYTAKNYYIGRNDMHDCGENAVDLKEVENFIVSQNIMHDFYGISAGSGGGGAAMVIHYGPTYSPKNTWVLFNEMYNTNDVGIQVGGDQEHDVYLIGNIIHDITNAEGTANGFQSWTTAATINLIGNVFYNVDNGIDSFQTSDLSQMVLSNNIIANLQNPAGFHLYVGNSAYLDSVDAGYNLFYQPGAEVRIDWNGQDYNVAEFQANTGNCQGCIEADPLFSDAANNDYRLQSDSPAIDAGAVSDLYQQFEDFWGLDIRFDFDGTSRPQGSAWDIGAYEYVPTDPELVLHAAPGDGSARLTWEILRATMPVTGSWRIDYESDTGTLQFPAVEIPTSTVRSHTLPGLTNYVWYTVTLKAMLGGSPWLTDTARVMPTDRFVYLPLVLRAP